VTTARDVSIRLPSQVSPPEFAVSELPPHAILGADVVAVAVQPGEDGGSLLLGPGAAGLADALATDLIGVLEAQQATGKTGEVVALPVPLGTADNADLRLVLLVGVGAARPVDFRRAGAAVAKQVTNRSALATAIPALAADAVEPFVVGLMLGSFGFHWRSVPPEKTPVRRVVLSELAEKETRPVLDRAVAVGGPAGGRGCWRRCRPT
jgi:leucyl aminopeptidase